MKTLIRRLISSHRGETMVESIVSMAILTVFLVIVTMAVQTSLRVTEQSTRNATFVQERVANPVIVLDYAGLEGDEIEVTFSDTVTGIVAVHPVYLTDNDVGVVGFMPAPLEDEEP